MPLAGVPEMVAVPLPLSTKLSPLGSVPDSDSAGAGSPVVVMVKLKAAPTMEVAVAALVIAGATFSVRVRVEPPARLTQPDSSPPYEPEGGPGGDRRARRYGDRYVERRAGVVDGDDAVGLAGGDGTGGLKRLTRRSGRRTRADAARGSTARRGCWC